MIKNIFGASSAENFLYHIKVLKKFGLSLMDLKDVNKTCGPEPKTAENLKTVIEYFYSMLSLSEDEGNKSKGKQKNDSLFPRTPFALILSVTFKLSSRLKITEVKGRRNGWLKGGSTEKGFTSFALSDN